MKKKTIIKLMIFLNYFVLTFIFMVLVPRLLILGFPIDIDHIENGPYKGHYLVTDGIGTVKILDLSQREVLWSDDTPAFFVHAADMLPDGNSILVADTLGDRLYQMNLSNKEILWEWNAKNSTHVNWTAFGLQQGWNEEAFEIIENKDPSHSVYTHLNELQFINGTKFGRSYDSILLCVRNFDMIIEINYTAKNPADPAYMNITWHYGVPGNHSILNHPHGPKRLPNGHVVICDSDNGRIVEINESNQIEWIYYDKELRWPRDCEYLSFNGNYLMTDSNNKRIIEVNLSSNQIVRSFSKKLYSPYKAVYYPDGRLLVTDAHASKIFVFDYETGELIDEVGFTFIFMPLNFTFVFVIIYQVVDFFLIWRNLKEKSVAQRFRSLNIYTKLILISLLILFLIYFRYIEGFLWHYTQY